MFRLRRLMMLVAVVALVVTSQPQAAQAQDGMDKRPPGEYFELRTRADELVVKTGLYVTPGDRFLSPENEMFAVVEVEGDTAWVESVGTITLPSPGLEAAAEGAWTGMTARLVPWLNAIPFIATPAQAPLDGPTVAIFHSHSAEAYEPTDGDAFVEGNQGEGIIEVGAALAAELENRGINVVHDITNHEPHDAGAYQRSRRTVTNNLMPQEPDLLIDVHRDTTPPDAYLSEVEGEQIAQVMLVVGRQNPNMQSNDAFAQRVKATVDEVQPGLMRGIFYADGDYNQDLSERLILVEIGSHENTREDAEAGAARFGQVIPDILGAAPSPAEQQAPWITLTILLVVVLGGGFLWLAMNEGSVSGAVARLRGRASRLFGLESDAS